MTDERCNPDLGPLTAKLLEQQREIARLIAERDEARRQICRIECANDTDWMSGPFPMRTSTPKMFAKLYGWDCFKEEGK